MNEEQPQTVAEFQAACVTLTPAMMPAMNAFVQATQWAVRAYRETGVPVPASASDPENDPAQKAALERGIRAAVGMAQLP